MKRDISHKLFELSQKLFPGGVNSPVRAFQAVKQEPFFVKKAKGAYLWDEDQNKYLDFVLSWGPLVLGHAHPKVISAMHAAAKQGSSYGANHRSEILLAEKIMEHYPHLEKLRFVSSGTEATMSALRLARGFTGRSKIIKFKGCYHGHADYLLVAAGSGAATLGVPDSAGVTPAMAQDTLVADYNHLNQVEQLFRQYGSQIAAVIVEPVAGNMGLVMPQPDFLKGLSSLCHSYDSLLIFDEVMTGFRIHLKGARHLFGVTPDLTCLGKVVGGGLPVGVYGGGAEIMNAIAPQGPVYQAGTLSGNPIAMAAGYATLLELEKPEIQKKLKDLSYQLMDGFQFNFRKLGKNFPLRVIGSMWGFFFNENKVYHFNQAAKSDQKLFIKYFSAMLERGIYVAPSMFEAGFLSSAHSSKDIDKKIEVQYQVLKKII